MSRLVPAVALLLAAGIAACSGTAKVRPDRLAADRIEAVAKAHAADDQFTVRFNPAVCDCPAFEVLLDGTWLRTFLEPGDPDGPVAALATDLGRSTASGGAATALIRGRLTKGARQAPTHAPCLVLRLVEVCPAQGCPPLP